MKSPKARCRLLGCMSYVPAEGYYPGLPQSHCPRCGMKTWCAMEGVSDFDEPLYPLPDWPFILIEKLINMWKKLNQLFKAHMYSRSAEGKSFKQEEKKVWTEEDILPGLYIVRNSASPLCYHHDVGFLLTVTFQLGYTMDRRVRPDKYCRISMSDGWCTNPVSKKQLAENLNKDEHGYRIATKDEIWAIIDYQKAAFGESYVGKN